MADFLRWASHPTKESIEEFKKLLIEEHGIELDDGRARDVAIRLLNLYVCKLW